MSVLRTVRGWNHTVQMRVYGGDVGDDVQWGCRRWCMVGKV